MLAVKANVVISTSNVLSENIPPLKCCRTLLALEFDIHVNVSYVAIEDLGLTESLVADAAFKFLWLIRVGILEMKL